MGFVILIIDAVVVYIACHAFEVEYVDIWRAVMVVLFSWLVGILLLPLLIAGLLGGGILSPWIPPFFAALCVFISVKFVMMLDWSVAAKIGAFYLVAKLLLTLAFGAMGI